MRKIIVFIVLFWAAAADAKWIYHAVETPLGDIRHVMRAFERGYKFEIKCKLGRAYVLYTTPEKLVYLEDLDLLNGTNPIAIIKSDGNDALELPIKLIENDSFLTAEIKHLDIDVLNQFKLAKKKLTVTLHMLGDDFHKNIFPIQGMKESVTKLIAGCNLS